MSNTRTAKKNLFILFLLSILILPVFLILNPPKVQSFSDNFKTKNVFLVSIDGLRATEAFSAGNPNDFIPNMWNKLRPQGFLFRNLINLGATWTTPGNDAIVSGCWELTPNTDGQLDFRPQYPTIFEYYRKAKPEITQEQTWAIVGKTNCSKVNYSDHPFYGEPLKASIDSPPDIYDRSDLETWSRTQAIMDQYHPSLVFLHLGDVDHYGHLQWNAYVNAIKQADRYVDDLWNKIQSDSIYKDQTTLIITTDHGRHTNSFGGHGGICDGCKNTFLFAIGPDIKIGQESNSRKEQIDIAPTIGRLMGFETPLAQGSLLTEIFKDLPSSTPFSFKDLGTRNEKRVTNNLNTDIETPEIAVNQKGIHIVWSDNRSGHKEVYYKMRPINSNVWTEDLLLSESGVEARAPAIAADNSDVYVTWQDYRKGNWSIFYRNLNVSGIWSAPTLVTNSDLEWGNNSCQMAWEPKITVCQGIPLISVTLAPDILKIYRVGISSYYVVSRPQSLPQKISLSASGNFAYLFWQEGGNNWEIRYASSPNCGGKWNTTASLTRFRGEHSISTSADKDNIYASWIRPKSSLLYSSQIINDENNWNTPRVILPNNKWNPRLAVNNSLVGLVWENYQSGLPTIYYSKTNNGGASWSEQRISFGDSLSVDPAIAIDNNSTYIIWKDRRDGEKWQIYFTQIDNFPPSITPTPISTPVPSPTLPTPTAAFTPTPLPTGSVESTLTIRQAEDTYISQYASIAFDRQAQIKIGYKQQNSALIRFNLSAIPARATISRALLSIYAEGWSGNNISLGAFRVLRHFLTNQASWYRAEIGSDWNKPGCNGIDTDRAETPEVYLNTNGIKEWYTFDLTQLAQDWVNHRLENNGLILKQITNTTNSFNFASNESEDPKFAPNLVVTYH